MSDKRDEKRAERISSGFVSYLELPAPVYGTLLSASLASIPTRELWYASALSDSADTTPSFSSYYRCTSKDPYIGTTSRSTERVVVEPSHVIPFLAGYLNNRALSSLPESSDLRQYANYAVTLYSLTKSRSDLVTFER